MFVLRYVDHFEVFVAVFGNVVLAALQIVAEQQIKRVCRRLRVLGHDLDETACLGVHGREPHHFGVVLAETFRAVDLVALALKGLDDVVFLLVRVGEPRLFAAGDLKKRGLGDVDIALANQRRAEAVDHRQDERPDLEAVDIGIGAEDDLVPAKIVDIKGVQVLDKLARHLDAAAEDLQKVGDDLTLENARIVGLETV